MKTATRPWFLLPWLLAGLLLVVAPDHARAVSYSWDLESAANRADFLGNWSFVSYPSAGLFRAAFDTEILNNIPGNTMVRISKGDTGGSGVRAGFFAYNFLARGDFDFQVDYTLYAPSQKDDFVFLGIENSSEEGLGIGRANQDNKDVYLAGSETDLGLGLETSDSFGRLRLRRTGDSVEAAVQMQGESAFTTLSTVSLAGDVGIFLCMMHTEPSAGGIIDGGFDNVSITANRFASPAPVPPSCLFLGSGLLLMAARRFVG